MFRSCAFSKDWVMLTDILSIVTFCPPFSDNMAKFALRQIAFAYLPFLMTALPRRTKTDVIAAVYTGCSGDYRNHTDIRDSIVIFSNLITVRFANAASLKAFGVFFWEFIGRTPNERLEGPAIRWKLDVQFVCINNKWQDYKSILNFLYTSSRKNQKSKHRT